MIASIPWWGWLLIAGLSWFIQLMMSVWTDKGGAGAWIIRVAFIAATVLSFLIGVIRFVKWVWAG